MNVAFIYVVVCFAALQLASKSLMDSLNEIYESQWSGHDMLYVQAQNLDMLWQDFAHKLADQVLVPLNTYQSQFPEMRVSSDKTFHVFLAAINNSVPGKIFPESESRFSGIYCYG